MTGPQSRNSAISPIDRLAQSLRDSGYEVISEPPSSALPFDLGGYRPDLLAAKGAEGLIIELKRSERELAVDRYTQLAKIVSRHTGWRFLLIPGDRIAGSRTDVTFAPPTWTEITERIFSAGSILNQGASIPAFLSAWAATEGLLRRKGEDEGVPVAAVSPVALVKHLYSVGILSADQFRILENLLPLRNGVVHGYVPSEDVSTSAARQLISLLIELLRTLHPSKQSS